MNSTFQDLRHGWRLLVRQPGFSCVAVLVLALGIGANTTIFSFVNALALKPRVGASDELVSVHSKDRVEPDTFRDFSYANYADLRARTEIFASLTAHTPAMAGITEGEITRRVFIDITTADLFTTYNAPLAMGRPFTVEEERPGADIPVTILSHRTWTRMGRPADVLGRTIRINQRDYTIIGVAAAGFSGRMVLVTSELWVPTGMYETVTNDFIRDDSRTDLSDRRHHSLSMVGRLRAGVTRETAGSLLEAASLSMEGAYPVENKNQQIIVAPVSRMSISTRPSDDSELSVLIVSLLSMSGIVLLVASLNLANMQLARASARRKEFAIRLSIGGTRARLVRQLVTEGLLVSAAGGAIALVIAWSATSALLSGMTGLLPITLNIDPAPDWRIFAATLAFSAAGTLLSSLGPALSLSRVAVLPELKEYAGEMPVARRSRFATRHLLVMGQLALSLTLLTAAGAFTRGAIVAAGVDPGFTLDRGIIVGIDASLASYDKARSLEVYGRLLDRVRTMPGVAGASIATLMPFGEITESSAVQLPGAVVRPSDPNAATAVTEAITAGITPGYFSTLGLTMPQGRDFTDHEARSEGGAAVAIIDRTLATRLFGDADPIGRRIQTNPRSETTPDVLEVIGVAPAILHQMNDKEPGPYLYRPFAQNFRSGVHLHVRSSQPGTDAARDAALLSTIRRTIQEVDARLPVLTLETRSMFRDRNVMLWVVRLGAVIFGVFGATALFMAALGIYGVKAYLVSRRTREIGIRLALGATTRNVIRLILGDGLALTATGLVVGVGLSALVIRGIGGLLFQGAGFDLPIVALAFTTLAGASLLANWIPARRATRIAPAIALRNS